MFSMVTHAYKAKFYRTVQNKIKLEINQMKRIGEGEENKT